MVSDLLKKYISPNSKTNMVLIRLCKLVSTFIEKFTEINEILRIPIEFSIKKQYQQ